MSDRMRMRMNKMEVREGQGGRAWGREYEGERVCVMCNVYVLGRKSKKPTGDDKKR
jgi:hypothetical protein